MSSSSQSYPRNVGTSTTVQTLSTTGMTQATTSSIATQSAGSFATTSSQPPQPLTTSAPATTQSISATTTSQAPPPPPTTIAASAATVCFPQPDGTRICRWASGSQYNSTEITSQSGFYDYHNDHYSTTLEAIGGKIFGTNIASACSALLDGKPPTCTPTGAVPAPTAPSLPSAPASGGTILDGTNQESANGSHDIHNAPGDYSNHQQDSSTSDQD